MKASGVGSGSNPGILFIAVVCLVTVQSWINRRKETNMNAKTCGRKAGMKSVIHQVTLALVETSWAIATNVVAGVVTLPTHQGAPA